MVHPLVGYYEWSLNLGKVGYAVLGKNGYSEGVDKLGQAVVDLGVEVIRSSGKYYAETVVILAVLYDLLTAFFYKRPNSVSLGKCRVYGLGYLFRGNLGMVLEFTEKSVF